MQHVPARLSFASPSIMRESCHLRKFCANHALFWCDAACLMAKTTLSFRKVIISQEF